ncbi:MAG: hypothetical protein ACI4BC_09735 [Muribaculaceae bacterium]
MNEGAPCGAASTTGNWGKNISIKIWFYSDNVLILWLKGKQSGGIELQPCFSRYILRANYCFFQHSPHPGSCKKAIAQKGVILILSVSQIWRFEMAWRRLTIAPTSLA